MVSLMFFFQGFSMFSSSSSSSWFTCSWILILSTSSPLKLVSARASTCSRFQGAHVMGPGQTVFGVRALLTSMTSSRWLHMATNRSKNSLLPPASISACMVPLRLNVLRQRMIRAR